jgi:pyrroline-5-carboxylate reductase
MTHPTITFIGGGNMARALIGGLVEAGHPPEQITVADPSDVQRRAAESDFGIRSSADNAQAAAGSRIVVLAVKPQIMQEVLASIRDVLARDTLVISVAAGVTLDGLARGLGERTRAGSRHAQYAGPVRRRHDRHGGQSGRLR